MILFKKLCIFLLYMLKSQNTINNYKSMYSRFQKLFEKYEKSKREPKYLYKELQKLTYTKGNNTEEKHYSHGTILGFINAFIFHLQEINFDKDVINKYILFIKDMKQKKQNEDDDAIINNEVINNSELKSFDEYKTMLDNYKNNDKKYFNYKHWIVGCLYIFDDNAHRVLDFAVMKLAYKLSDASDTNFNYFVLSNNSFIVNKYKTAAIYGQLKSKVNSHLVAILKDYIYKSDLKNGDFMFGNQMYIHRAVDDVFHTTVNSLRKARANMNNSDMTKKTLIASAKSMNHSLNTEIRHYLKN